MKAHRIVRRWGSDIFSRQSTHIFHNTNSCVHTETVPGCSPSTVLASTHTLNLHNGHAPPLWPNIVYKRKILMLRYGMIQIQQLVILLYNLGAALKSNIYNLTVDFFSWVSIFLSYSSMLISFFPDLSVFVLPTEWEMLFYVHWKFLCILVYSSVEGNKCKRLRNRWYNIWIIMYLIINSSSVFEIIHICQGFMSNFYMLIPLFWLWVFVLLLGMGLRLSLLGISHYLAYYTSPKW
jgi:hypothetical protein